MLHIIKHNYICPCFYCISYHIESFNLNFYLSYKWCVLLSHLYSLFDPSCCTSMREPLHAMDVQGRCGNVSTFMLTYTKTAFLLLCSPV